MAYRGKFRPRNPNKYKGDPNKIVYRSSWELKFFHYCDKSPGILKWASEEIIIPYSFMGKKHRYFPDVWFQYLSHDGSKKEKLIEIKPHAQRFPPRQSKNRAKYLRECETFAKNQAKWKAAEEFCDFNGLDWSVYDEYDLRIKERPKKRKQRKKK